MKHMVNELKLVFPPLSNREAFWLSEDEGVKKQVSESKLYMLGQREEAFFDEDSFVATDKGISFRLKIGDYLSGEIIFKFTESIKNIENIDEIELGSKMIRFKFHDGTEPLWLTPNSIIWHISHESSIFDVIDELDLSKFTDYKLLYVGISKRNDSLTRLFSNSHKARTDILSDLSRINHNSEITDELTVFYFDIDSLNINTFDPNMDIQSFLSYQQPEKEKIVSDAEKAIVSVMKPPYNRELYNNYPKSRDGLEDENMRGYGFSIKENYTFYTDTSILRGKVYDEANAIIIRDEKVTLI